MDALLHPKALHGSVEILPSKSYLHRLLIAAALAEKPCTIAGASDAADIRRTSDCLIAAGARGRATPAGFAVTPIPAGGACYGAFPCGESGTTLRFLLPVIAALGAGGTFYAQGRLSERPVTALADSLRARGAVVGTAFPLTLAGKLRPGTFRVRSDISSQYISGLLFALPLLEGDSEIVYEGVPASVNYIEMTASVLRAFGIRISETASGFSVPGRQRYLPPRGLTAEGDWSNAAFWLVAGAIGGDITVQNLRKDSLQGDRRILAILAQAGAEVTKVRNGFRVRKSALTAVAFDAADIPDLVPVASVLCACASGLSRIRNVARLRVKECDRLAAVIEQLTALGIACRYDEGRDTLEIEGGSALRGAHLKGYNDHRMVMTAAVAATVAGGPVTVTDAEAIQKSYPGFFTAFEDLGGIAHV